MKPSYKQKKRLVIIISCLCLLTLMSYVAHKHLMLDWEVTIFNSIYGWPKFLTTPMLLISLLGSTWMVVILAAVLLYMKKHSIALQVLIVAISTFVIVEVIKQVIARPRPYILLPGVLSRDLSTTGMGFPSGHTAVVTVVALLLFKFLPRPWRWLIIIWISSVAVSRIYLGVHAPLDIIGGFVLGVLTYNLFVFSLSYYESMAKHR